jgi:hypothetical protein
MRHLILLKNVFPPLQEKPKEGEGGEDDEEEALDEEDEFGEGDYEQVWLSLHLCPSGRCFSPQVLWNNTYSSFALSDFQVDRVQCFGMLSCLYGNRLAGASVLMHLLWPLHFRPAELAGVDPTGTGLWP